MVLELIFSRKKVENHPYLIFIESFLIVVISFFLLPWIFQENLSILLLTFSSLSLSPLLYLIFLDENRFIRERTQELIFGNLNILYVLFWVFMGTMAAYSFLFSISNEKQKQNFFKLQIEELKHIQNASNTGNFLLAERSKERTFWEIVKNNLKILGIFFLLSFVYGVGAIYVLVWNSSLLGIILAENSTITMNLTKNFISLVNSTLHLLVIAPYLLPEILAYILFSLIGITVSISISKKLFFKHFRKIFLNSLFFFVLAIFLLLFGALIETYYLE
jgi:uncharacterized membrane protein SpoIIM required for sporulation